MPRKRLSELLAALSQPYKLEGARGQSDLWVQGIEQNSRRIQPGDLFVAIRGHSADGHRFIPEAIQRGAVAVVAERPPRESSTNSTPSIVVRDSRKALAELAAAFYDHPTKRLFVVGITGTKGKTSVAHMSAAVLGERDTLLISTVTNALQRGLDQTTPEPTAIQHWTCEALREGRQNLVLEVSAHALHQQRVHAVDFDVAVFTSFSHDHLDYFHDFESYLDAKLSLFRALKPAATAIVNLSDPAALRVLSATPARTLTYGLPFKADVWADDVKLSPEGSRCRVHTPKGSFSLELKLPGPFMIENALAAVGIGLVRDVPLAHMKEHLEGVERVEGRLELYKAKGGFTIVIDFAHSPDSLERVLRFLKRFYPRVITVFGCGGDSDRLKRPQMGEISGRISDYTVLTSDNPKSEDPLAIIREIERGLQPLGAPYAAIPDRRAAIQRALELAQPGDCVLIAGKGHERFQLFKDRVVPFNDLEYLIELGVVESEPSRANVSPQA
jgi:UDP-N-acetylmuramoyl-L-alanyl-D-glutamate--2,6-diaminopimelate ligase